MSFDKEDKHEQHDKQSSSDRQVSGHNTVNMAGKDGQMDVGRQSHDQTLQVNGNNMEFHPLANNGIRDILPEFNQHQLGGQNGLQVMYMPAGDVGEGDGHGHGHGHGKHGQGNDVIVTANGQTEVLHGEKAREAEAVRELAATGNLDTAHMSKQQLDKAVKDGVITQDQAQKAESGKTGTDSTGSGNTSSPDTHVMDTAPTEAHSYLEGMLATGQSPEHMKEMVQQLLDKIQNLNNEVEGLSNLFAEGFGRDFSGGRQMGGRFNGEHHHHHCHGGDGQNGSSSGSGAGASGAGDGTNWPGSNQNGGNWPGSDGSGQGNSNIPGSDGSNNNWPPVVPTGWGGDGSGTGSNTGSGGQNGGDVPPVIPPVVPPAGTNGGDVPPATTPGTGAQPGDNTGGTTTPGDNTGGTGTGTTNPASAAAQAAASLVTSDGSVDPSIMNDVKQTILNSPQAIIDALNTDKPQIIVTNASLGGGAGAYFDEANNQVVISADKNYDKEFAQHEFAHVWDYVNNVTNSSQWQQLAQKDFSQVSPGSLGLTVGLVDPPFVQGYGTGDVMAEMVAYDTGNDQTGNGGAMAQAWPDLNNYLKQQLGIA